MSGAAPPWLAAWQAAQQELLEGWPAAARELWKTLQGAPATAPGAPEVPAGPGGPIPSFDPPSGGAGGAPAPWAWPALGMAREDQEAWERLAQQAARLGEVQGRLGAAWGVILQRSLARLGEVLRERAAAGRPVATLRALYDLWVDAAESVYADAAATDSYVELQAECANASSELRICQRELLERWARQFDLPTRAELDSVHGRLRALEAAKPAARPKSRRGSRAPGRRRGRTA